MKFKSIRSGAVSLFEDFCSNSSIHGVRYFTDRKVIRCEKAWWILVFSLSLASCGLLIQQTYRKWEESPVIVSFVEKPTTVWQIPFPAVTICPEAKSASWMLNYTAQFHTFLNQSQEERSADIRLCHLTNRKKSNLLTVFNYYYRTDFFLAMTQICDRNCIERMLHSAASIPNKTTDESYVALIWLLRVPTDGLLVECSFLNEPFPCDTLFYPSLTEEGVCLTFNGLSSKDMHRLESLQGQYPYVTSPFQSQLWSQENGYQSQATFEAYPFRAGSGYSLGLSVYLSVDLLNHDPLCRGSTKGFKLLLHSPAEYPQITKKFVRVPINQEVTIAVKPQMITTTHGLQGYTPERRQCFFNQERHLQFFAIYTQDNCELECLTNYTLKLCGCVLFSMPRNESVAICETNEIRCIWWAKNLLYDMGITGNREEEIRFRSECNCLPACSSVQYDEEITQTQFDWKNWAETLGIQANRLEGIEFAHLAIYYKEPQFMPLRRSELYGTTDFLANCGGLLGLCLGVSLLSLVELLYFCLIRPFTLWKEKRSSTCSLEDLEAPSISLLSYQTKWE
ncbi:pickpocket protein 28-like [Wyeomyia smithii]|uniref:pickpocket protein 28-like n=1 Tax=Wyeomyia smithii TaxID=174621 RepID=UPI002467D8F2|nr:pickpocket protein 28-like [Wyeomyia smithii]